MVTLTINNVTIILPTKNAGVLIPIIVCQFVLGVVGLWFFFHFFQLCGEDNSLAKVKDSLF